MIISHWQRYFLFHKSAGSRSLQQDCWFQEWAEAPGWVLIRPCGVRRGWACQVSKHPWSTTIRRVICSLRTKSASDWELGAGVREDSLFSGERLNCLILVLSSVGWVGQPSHYWCYLGWHIQPRKPLGSSHSWLRASPSNACCCEGVPSSLGPLT